MLGACLLALTGTTAGCQLRQRSSSSDNDSRRASRRAPGPPKAVFLELSFAPLSKTAHNIAALGRAAGEWDADQERIWLLLEEIANLVTPLSAQVEWRRAFHALLVRPPPIAEKPSPTAVVWILPVRSVNRAIEAIGRRCPETEQRRDIHLFSGERWGALPCNITVARLPKAIALSTSAHAIQLVHAYARRLSRREAKPTARARFYASNFLGALGMTPERLKMGSGMVATMLAMLQGDFAAGPRIKRSLDQILEYLADSASLGAEIGLEERALTLTLFAVAKRGSGLHKWIQSTRGRRLTQLSILPPRAPLMLALSGPRRKKQTQQKLGPPGLIWSTLLGRLPKLLQPAIRAMRQEMSELAAGELQVAMTPVDDEGGVCLILVAEPPNPEMARATFKRGVRQAISKLRDHVTKKLGLPTGALLTTVSSKTKRREVTETLRVGLAGVADRLSGVNRRLLDALSDNGAVTLALGSSRRGVVLTLGRNAPQQLRATMRRLRRHRRPKSALLRRYARRYGQRLGLAHVDLVGLARALPIFDDKLVPAADSRGGAVIHWGTKPHRRRVDLEVRFPVEHVGRAAPFWAAVFRAFTKLLPDLSKSPLAAMFTPPEPEPEDAL